MSPEPISRAAMVAVLVAWMPLAGCDDRGDDPGADPPPEALTHRSLCANANDYAWYLNSFGGAYGAPASPDEARQVVPRLVQLSAALVDQVPGAQDATAQTAHAGWVTIQRIFEKYDYDGRRSDEIVAEMTAALREDQQSNRRFGHWLTRRCADPGGRFPSRPANPPG